MPKNIPIIILPNQPTVQQVQALRVQVEKHADPEMYFFCAWAFTLVDMPNASMAMFSRGLYYA